MIIIESLTMIDHYNQFWNELILTYLTFLTFIHEAIGFEYTTAKNLMIIFTKLAKNSFLESIRLNLYL